MTKMLSFIYDYCTLDSYELDHASYIYTDEELAHSDFRSAFLNLQNKAPDTMISPDDGVAAIGLEHVLRVELGNAPE